MKQIGNLLLAIFLFGLVSLRSEAAVYTSDGTATNVQYLHDHVAQGGDTIRVPAGTFTWTTGVTLIKNITLQGAGINQTIVKDGVQGTCLIRWNYSTLFNARPRLTGITFKDGGRTRGGSAPSGILHFDGSNTKGSYFRFDNCQFLDMAGTIVTQNVLGVFDHDTFVNSAKAHVVIYVYNKTWNGGEYADGSWSDTSHFGTDQFLFIENCTATNLENSVSALVDGYGGARFVVRHCVLTKKKVTVHGTESGGNRVRGGRAVEVYNNVFNGGSLGVHMVIEGRSGVVIAHHNTISGFWEPQFLLRCYRTFYPFQPWAGADGTSQWDVNDTAGPFYNGAASAVSQGTTVSVANANFTPNRWVGYSIKRTTNLQNLNTLNYATILSNNAHSITYTNNGGWGTRTLGFSAGDTFAIYKIVHALDQPGRSGGTFVTRNPPIRLRPNDQITEPCYSWSNGGVNFGTLDPVIREGVHYHNNTVLPGYVPYVYPHPLVTD